MSKLRKNNTKLVNISIISIRTLNLISMKNGQEDGALVGGVKCNLKKKNVGS